MSALMTSADNRHEMAEVTEDVRQRGLHLHFFDRTAQQTAAAEGLLPLHAARALQNGSSSGSRLCIGVMRSVLQSILAVLPQLAPTACGGLSTRCPRVSWILDDDKRLQRLQKTGVLF